MRGYPDGSFKPNGHITRAEVVTALNRMLGRTPDAEHIRGLANPYTDLSETHWAYADILEAAVEHGAGAPGQEGGSSMKRKLRKPVSALISAALCAALLLQMPGVALAFDLSDGKWSFMQLAAANTGEVLSESHSLDKTDALSRAYNPHTERAVLSFAVEKTQPYAIEIWTRAGSGDLYDGDPRGDFVGYLKGAYEDVTPGVPEATPTAPAVFDKRTAQYFKGYGGLLDGIAGDNPYPDVDEANFINVIEWDGEAVDGGGEPVTLADNAEYVIALQPLTPLPVPDPPADPPGEPEFPPPDAYLAVKLDRTLPPAMLGAPVGAHAPFDALSSLSHADQKKFFKNSKKVLTIDQSMVNCTRNKGRRDKPS
jgi:hypothetical protein